MMRQTLKKIIQILDGQPTGHRGQSLVEMALTTPILILCILGVTELGFFANNYLILTDAVRTGGRTATTLDPNSWKYGDARNQNRLDCDRNLKWYVLQLGTDAVKDPNGYFLYGARNRDPQVDTSGPVPSKNPRAMNLTNGGTPGAGPNVEPLNLGYRAGQENEFGFYDTVACQVLNGISPLKYNDDDPANGLHPTSKDDVVISAISYTTMRYTSLGSTETLINVPVGNQGRYYPSAANYGEARITVTGRWPLENRFCATSSGNVNWSDWSNGYGPAGWYSGDLRDPFDYLHPLYNTQWKSGSGANLDGSTLDVDGGGNSLNEGIALKPVSNTDPWWDAQLDTSGKRYVLDLNKTNDINGSTPVGAAYNNNQGVRGYTFSGHAKSNLPSGSPDSDQCYGSPFRVQDIEARLNLDANFNPKAPNGGLVVVEVFWQHHPLFFGPLFQGFNRNDPTLDPILHVWAWFPVPSIEATETPKP